MIEWNIIKLVTGLTSFLWRDKVTKTIKRQKMDDRLVEDLDTFMIGIKEDLEAVEALEAMVRLLLQDWCKTRGLHGIIFRRIKNRSNYRARFSVSVLDGTNIRQIGNGNLKTKTLKLDPLVDFWIRKIIGDFFELCGFVLS